nr:glutamate-rich protein 6B [Marmota flaviventris]
MSSENNSVSGDLSPPSPTTSGFPTQNFPSAKEDAKVELDRESLRDKSTPGKTKKSLKGKHYPGKEEYLEKREHSRQEDYLEEEDALEEYESTEEEEYLEEDKFINITDYVFKGENLRKAHPFQKHLGQDFKSVYSSLILSRLNARSPIASTSQATFYYGVPRSATISADSEQAEVSIRHQASQTKWAYESKLVFMKPEIKPDEDNSMSSYSEALDEWASIIDEAVDKELKNYSDNFFRRSYQTVFKRIVREMYAANELEDDLNIPLTLMLETENRRKLGMLLKANFEALEDPIVWLMKRHEGLKSSETLTFHLPSMMEPEPEGKKRVGGKKKVELDIEWIQEVKVRKGDGKLILYPNENIFQVLFPDGTGQIHYPSGRLALLISCTDGEEFTYIILEDSLEASIRALVNNSGHATFNDENGFIWSSLSNSLGYYFPKGKNQKAWNWWNLQVHVHVPPFQPISLKINSYIQVHIRSQDKIIFSFLHRQKQFRLNLGTKFKFINSEVLQDLKEKTILEVDPGTTARKVQILLGKMIRILNLLTMSDLKNFTEASKMCLMALGTKKKRSRFCL